MYREEALIYLESVIPAQAGIQKNQRTGPRRSQGVTGSTLLRSTPILDPFSGGLQGRFDQRGGETFLPRAGGGEIGLEAVAEGHLFVDFGDDAVLFREGWDWKWTRLQLGHIDGRQVCGLFCGRRKITPCWCGV